MIALFLSMALAADPYCPPKDTKTSCRIDRIEEKVDKLLEMWFYPPPISYDGKQTWVRIDPSINRRMDAIEKKLNKLVKEIPPCKTIGDVTVCE